MKCDGLTAVGMRRRAVWQVNVPLLLLLLVMVSFTPPPSDALVHDGGWSPEEEDMPPCPTSCDCSFSTFPSFPRPLLTVNCTGAGLNDFPADTPNTTEALLLAHNRLLNLSSLPALPSLRLLDLSHNHIGYLANHWVFEHMGLLVHLDLSGNNLRTLQHGSFSGLHSLDVLDLSDNNIKTVELHAFGGLNHLSVLRLGHNELYELKRPWLLSMTSLGELYVQGNYISVIESRTFDKITSLLHLDLSDNALRRVSENGFLGLHHVKVCNLSDNDFVTIPTKELRRLSSLDILLLDGIKITRLREGDFEDMAVSSISLSFLPKLTVVHKGAFSNMSQLRTLQLHDNPQLLFIHPHAFSGVPLLHRLLVHNNQLITLSLSIKDSLPTLDELHLYHNPLHCDCNIFWLKRDMVSVYVEVNGTETSYIKDADKLVCNSPEVNSNVLLSTIPLQMMSPVCAPTTLPFFSDSVNVSIGDDLRLECQAIGVPEPTLFWTLPDGQTVNSSSDTLGVLSQDNTVLTLTGVQVSDAGTYACRANNSISYDISSTAVTVRNKDLRLAVTDHANDYITVAWIGSIPRPQMAHFQILYRKNDGSGGGESAGVGSEGEEWERVYLHGRMHRCTLIGLKPMTSYEICLVYRETYSVQCRNFTTDHRVALAQPAITRVDMTRVVASVCAVVGVLLVLCLARVLTRRLRRRKDYQDPLKEGGEMDKIPLEPIDHRAPGTPLCSSRTALLPNSQI
ncbi:leucine-rich repeat neuronal protein 3-like [Littorina saxatilis]|uniref:Ig-like domain-containing protein n=1 Tax=Littorina saxatilis TaxID=31220 RepID=A0AAN9GCY2_9CAEN